MGKDGDFRPGSRRFVPDGGCNHTLTVSAAYLTGQDRSIRAPCHTMLINTLLSPANRRNIKIYFMIYFKVIFFLALFGSHLVLCALLNPRIVRSWPI